MGARSFAVLALFLGTGFLSYAAEQALPGDPLYVVKTGFNENLQSMLSFTPESKAKLEASLAEKRLVEVQKLAVSDRLSKDTQEELELSFIKHTDEFKKSIETIRATEPETAVSLSSDFQSTLKAHRNVLSTITATTSTSVAANVTKEISDLSDVRKLAEGNLSFLSESQIKALAEEKFVFLSSALSELAPSTSTDASSTDTFTTVKSITDEGKRAMENRDYAGAFIHFQTAIREVQSALLTLKNTAALNIDPTATTATTTASSTSQVPQVAIPESSKGTTTTATTTSI